MQAIESKFIPASNFKPSRIKAWCARGSITISDPRSVHDLTEEQAHVIAVNTLISKFAKEDVKAYGPNSGKPWNGIRVCGQLQSGNYAHVFVEGGAK